MALIPGGLLPAQSTIHVPADQSTIQAGIDAAKNGDTVLVAPGTYNEDIDFKGKAITVTSGAASFSDPLTQTTILNGTGLGPAVIFQTHETAASVLNGLTIQNGTSGVYLPGTSATISNDVITKDDCGVVATGGTSSPVISGNDIEHAGTYSGPIPYPTCIANNQPYSYQIAGGYGISVYEAGNVQILGNTIEHNGAHGIGGGDPSLDDGGGGIIAYSSINATALLLEDNIIRNNFGTGGPALSATNIWHMTIVQNLVYGNISSFGEAGIGSGSDYFAPRGLIFSLVVTNNSIYGNVNQNDATERPPQSGNQASFGSDLLTVENGLFIATDPYGTVACSAAAGYTVTATNNDAFYAGATQPLQCGTAGNGNLAADPQFLNPAAGDFHVQRTSPVVGAGNVSAPGLPPADLDGKNRTVCGSVDMGVYQTHPIPPVTLASSPNPSVGGSSVTLSAHVTGNCNIPTGVLTFFDGATPLGKGVLDGSGDTSFTTSALTVGTHNVSATYPGDFNFDPSTSNTIPQVVTGYPTATALTASPDPAAAFQTIALQSAVSSQFGTPGGTVSFYAGTTLLGSANLNSSGQAQTTMSTLGAGTYSLTAVYNATTEYASSTSPAVTEVVNGAPTATSLAAVPNPSTFGQAVTFTAAVSAPQSSAAPTGTVSFRDGSTSLGQSAISASGVATFTTSALAVGSHAISAVYSGSSNDNPSTSSTTTQIVALAPVSVTLTPEPNPANQGQAVALVVTVSAAGLPGPCWNGRVQRPLPRPHHHPCDGQP